MLRCELCAKPVVADLKEQSWYRLLFFLECLHAEGTITDRTHEAMVDALMNFKAWAVEAEAIVEAADAR
jgi:hypothetical protein